MAEDGKVDFSVALAQVLKEARANDTLARGLREVCKAIENQKAAFVVLAESCDDQKYTDCVKALCDDKQIPRINVADGKKLGEWCGLCRMDSEQKIVKVVKCSSCAILKTLPQNIQSSPAYQTVINSVRK